MALQERKCQTAKSTSAKGYDDFFDAHGLSLRVTKTGKKSWLYQYTFNKKRMSMTFGSFPTDFTLSEAREQVRKYQKEISKGRDPKIVKRESKYKATEATLNTIESLKELAANERIAAKKWSDSHIRRTEMTWKHLKPIYDVPITELTKRRVRDLLIRINTEVGTSTAQKCKALLSVIYTYAVVNEIVDANIISAFSDDPILKKPRDEDIEKHQPIPDDRIGEAFALIDDSGIDLVTKYALHMIQYTGLRVKSLLTRKWKHYEKAKSRFFIEKEYLKNPRATYCPVTKDMAQMLDTLMQLQKAINTKWTSEGYIFSTDGKTRISLEAPNNSFKKLRLKHKLGYVAKPHGFRTTCEDHWIDGRFIDSAINVQMNHTSTTGNRVRDRYISKDKDFFEERKKMVQFMNDFIKREIKIYRDTQTTIKNMRDGRVKTSSN